MLQDKLTQWVKQEREKGNTMLTISTVGVLENFCSWLESDAEHRRAVDQSAIELLREIRSEAAFCSPIERKYWFDSIDAILKTADGN